MSSDKSFWTWSKRKEIALIVVILTLAGTAAFLSIKLTRSRMLANTALSDQWQCAKTAAKLTVCTRKHG